MHDDIIFALDNLKLDEKEERVKEALKDVGMEDYINSDTYELSMGQKQRIAIAGVLSVEPEIIVMDEPTSMLDPKGKEDIRKIILELKEAGFTIIFTTNIIAEICFSDRVIMLEDGKVIKEFMPEDILYNIDFLKQKGIEIPKVIENFRKLKADGIDIELTDLI